MKRNYYFSKKGSLTLEDKILKFVPAIEKDSPADVICDDFVEISAQKRDIPIEDIASISLFADINISSNVFKLLAEKNIPVFFYDKHFSPIGAFHPYSKSDDGKSIILQAGFFISKSRRLSLACSFVDAAVHNITKNLEYYNNRGKKLDKQIEYLKKINSNVFASKDINSLMLLEALARKVYYSAFNSILNDNFKFTKREFYPPSDPINSLLSFFNAMLYSAIESEMFSTKLNKNISFLHEPGASRNSLVWDLSEIFKPILVERLIFSIVNHKIVSTDDFETFGPACYIKKDAKKKLIRHFDDKINKTILNRETKRHQSFRSIIKYECYKLIDHFNGVDTYSPFKVWW
jgi:CRISPR-associated protein Cas1